jgi:hypothetical protein
LTFAKASTPPDSDNENFLHNSDFQPQSDEEDLPQNDESNVSRSQNDELPLPQTGRQKAMASVNQVHPPAMIAKLTTGLKKATMKVVEDVRSHYAVSDKEQPDGILSDGYRVGMKQAAAVIPRSSLKYTLLHQGMTCRRQQQMNCWSWSAMKVFFMVVDALIVLLIT